MPRHRSRQPIRVPTGGPQGQRQVLEAAQSTIPLIDRQGGRGPTPPSGPAAAPSPVARPEVFGPTGRPGEPLTAGAPAGPGPNGLGILPEDPLELARAVLLQFPSPGLRRLIERSAPQ